MAAIHKTLAAQCGAVLLGAKPAALFSLRDGDCGPDVLSLLEEGGLGVQRLRCRPGRALLLVYQPQMLAAALADGIAARALAKIGYTAGGEPEAMLLRLQVRMEECESFPHEIGFFLGYPPADVLGFMVYEGRRSKHSGMWKVYSNVERAKALCDKYEACRRFCCRHIERGGDLRSLLGLVNKAG